MGSYTVSYIGIPIKQYVLSDENKNKQNRNLATKGKKKKSMSKKKVRQRDNTDHKPQILT